MGDEAGGPKLPEKSNKYKLWYNIVVGCHKEIINRLELGITCLCFITKSSNRWEICNETNFLPIQVGIHCFMCQKSVLNVDLEGTVNNRTIKTFWAIFDIEQRLNESFKSSSV